MRAKTNWLFILLSAITASYSHASIIDYALSEVYYLPGSFNISKQARFALYRTPGDDARPQDGSRIAMAHKSGGDVLFASFWLVSGNVEHPIQVLTSRTCEPVWLKGEAEGGLFTYTANFIPNSITDKDAKECVLAITNAITETL
jgi:hypothetical protein